MDHRDLAVEKRERWRFDRMDLIRSVKLDLAQVALEREGIQ